MFKSVEGIYEQGEIKFLESLDNIPQNTRVIITFLTNIQDSKVVTGDLSLPQILSNEEIDKILRCYRQENKPRPFGLSKSLFKVPDDFNEPLPSEILDLFDA